MLPVVPRSVNSVACVKRINSVLGKWGFGFCNWGLTFGWKIAS